MYLCDFQTAYPSIPATQPAQSTIPTELVWRDLAQSHPHPYNRPPSPTIELPRMTPLVPERSLLFSPALAATIGLEEAILLHLLHDLATSAARADAPWHEVEHSVLARLLPFWDQRDIQRIVKNIADKGVLAIEVQTITATRLRFSFLSASSPAPAAAPKTYAQPVPTAPQQTARYRTEAARAPDYNREPIRESIRETTRDIQTGTTRGATRLPADWRPSEDLLQLLGLNHGISRQFALDQLEDFLLYWRERNEVDHAWSSRFRQHVLRQWRHELQNTNAQTARQTPQTDWYPSEDALQILERSGVNRAFIEDAIPEFVLYWRERGEANGTWNSKFIAHIRRQWSSFTHALENERDPAPIQVNWRPCEDVYDILRMANIDIQFAEQQIPEFILFWRDTGTAHRSWNTKFLQHVKYQWAARHHLPGAKAVAAASSSTFDQLTDRSWAAGLISGA